MLPRAALRAIRAPTISSTSTSQLRYASPRIPSTALRIQSYASKPPRPPPTPPPSSSKPKRPPPPPPQPFQGTTRSARQTSPGSSFPKDQTWKPQDGIKMAGPAAAIASGAGQGGTTAEAAQGSAPTLPDGSRPERPMPSPRRDGPLEQDAVQNEEPLAQKIDVDKPLPGGIRDQTQQAQAQSENATTEPSQSTSQPLPDLRQGIPSTFSLEFGGQQGKVPPAEEKQPTQQDDNLDLTYEQTEGQQQRDRGERDYDRSAYETSLDRRRARFANYLYASILLATVSGSLYLSRPFSPSEPAPPALPSSDATGWTPGKMYARVKARWTNSLGYYTEPAFPKLLPEVPESQRQPFTLVLSLEDLMIHSTWTREHGYRTAKRPGIDYFIRYLSQYYELVLFTTVPIAMADPVIKKLDPYHFIMWPLGREATKYDGGEYVKDLAYLNRPLNKTIMIDTHAPHVKNQPENAIIIPKWSGDPKDPHTKDLVALIPFLEYVATMGIDDVRPVLKSFAGTHIPTEFARRESLARDKFNAELAATKRGSRSGGLGSLASGLGMKGSAAQAGGMVLADGQSVAEGLAKGKMLSDQIREQGQKQYEYLEQQIREHGAQWLKEEEEEQKRAMEMYAKDMKKGAFSWFGGSSTPKAE